MIEIEDAEVPANAAPLTVDETLDGLRDKTITPAGGDLILELRDRTRLHLVGRMWLGKDGVIAPDGLRHFCQSMAFGSTYYARILWIARPGRVH